MAGASLSRAGLLAPGLPIPVRQSARKPPAAAAQMFEQDLPGQPKGVSVLSTRLGLAKQYNVAVAQPDQALILEFSQLLVDSLA